MAQDAGPDRVAITAWRIVWRFIDGPPPYPPKVAAWERSLAHAVYWLFFFVLLWMPITGSLTSSFGGHAVKLFDVIATPALLLKDDAKAKLFDSLHLLANGRCTP